MLTTDQYARLAVAGGGFTLDAQSLSVDDLARIAVAASTHGARIVIKNASAIPIDSLARIAIAGKGTVFFEDL